MTDEPQETLPPEPEASGAKAPPEKTLAPLKLRALALRLSIGAYLVILALGTISEVFHLGWFRFLLPR